MDRRTVYRGALPYESDLLYAGRYPYESLGLLAMDLLGTSSLVSGCACTPTSPLALAVKIAPGRIYSLQSLEATDWGMVGGVGGLVTDSNVDHQILKQGLLRDTTTLTGVFPAPGTSGQSINYLIQAAFSETDTDNTVLPFFNAAAPDVPWAGPGNSGGVLPITRKDSLVLSVKAGVAAATGSQTTPAVDAGNVGLYVVTVANGQTTIASGNISLYGGAPFLTETLTQKISQVSGDARYLRLANARLPLSANTTFYIANTGNDTTGDGTSGNPWKTLGAAYLKVQKLYDTRGFVVTFQLDDYSNYPAATLSGPLVGQTTPAEVVIAGNAATPSNVLVNGVNCINRASCTIQNFKIVNSAGDGLAVSLSAVVSLGAGMVFGACLTAQMSAVRGGEILRANNYTINGSATTHMNSGGSGNIASSGITVTLSGTPAFSVAFAFATQAAVITDFSTTYSGSATGVRYSAVSNGVIDTNGAGASYFPGNSAGAETTGGRYI